MTLIFDADLAPTNTTYDMAIDGNVVHASATVAVGKKYIAADGNYPNGSGGFLATGSLALCTLTSPQTWVALKAPPGMRLADSSTGIVWECKGGPSPNWNAVEARLDIVVDPTDVNYPDVTLKLQALITAAATVSWSLPIYIGPTPIAPFVDVPVGYQISDTIVNKFGNPIICLVPLYFMDNGTNTNRAAVQVGIVTQIIAPATALQSVYWVEYSNNNTPNYAQNVTGIEVINIADARMMIKARYFWMGANFIGDANSTVNPAGCLGNNIELITYGNLKAVGWTGRNGPGFVNENVFHGGSQNHNDPTYTADSAALLSVLINAGGEANGNKWYGGPDFEPSAVTGVPGNVIEVSGTATGSVVFGNDFHGMRIDGVAVTNVIFFKSTMLSMTGNMFHFDYIRPGYLPTFAGVTGSEPAITACALNTFELPMANKSDLRYAPKPVVSFGRGNVTARLSGGSTLVQAPARGKFLHLPGPTYANESSGSFASLTSSSIRMPTHGGTLDIMGRFIDLRSTPFAFLNKLLVKVALRNGTAGGRLTFVGYKADGTTLISSINDMQFNTTVLYTAPSWNTVVDLTATTCAYEIAWSANVAFLFIGIAGGTHFVDFTKLEVFAPTDSGVAPLLDSMTLPALLGAGLPLIDDDLPYAVGTPCDPQGATVTAITNANPGAVTTAAAHGFSTGDIVFLNSVSGMTLVNAKPYTITVTGTTSFTLGVDTTGFGTYSGGGVASYDFVPRGQVVRSLLPTGTSGTAREWVRTQTGAGFDTWTTVNF